MASNNKAYLAGSIYCPDDIDRFCIASEIEYFKNDGVIPYKDTTKIFATT